MAKILVTWAGSAATADVASQIAHVLAVAGHDVVLTGCDTAEDAWHYDAVIVGSDLHGHRQWSKAAVRYLHAQAPDLAERPTFLFQCPRSRASSTTPHNVRVLAYEIGTSAPTSFGEGDADRRRTAVAAWSGRVDAALRSSAAARLSRYRGPAEAATVS